MSSPTPTADGHAPTPSWLDETIGPDSLARFRAA